MTYQPPKNPRLWQPGREDMKAALRHIEKLVGMLCMEACVEVDQDIALSVDKSEDFVRIYKERLGTKA